MLHRSPGITAIYNEVKNSRKNRILDLGGMSAASFSFFSSLSCKIHFENLNDFVEEFGNLSTDNLVYRLGKYLSPHEAGEKFDVILAWDLFNYFSIDVVHALLNKLNEYCKPNTLIHSVTYLGTRIPKLPGNFGIKDKYHVDIRVSSLVARKHERSSTAAFLKKNPLYFLHNNIMNEQGMVRGISEQVHRYMPDKNCRKQYVSSTGSFDRELKDSKRSSVANKNSGKLDGTKFCSPSLRTLFSAKNRKVYRLLDLGEKNNANMEVWRKHFYNVYSEDLYSSLQWRKLHGDLSVDNDLVESGLSREALTFNDQKFDVIMFWDVLNYCTKSQIAAIAERLQNYCHNQTQFVAFAYAGNSIPVRPQKYFLTAEGDLQVVEAPKAERQVEAITTAGIMKLSRNWRINKTHVFQPGMKSGVAELVFDYEGEVALTRPVLNAAATIATAGVHQFVKC